MNPMNPAFDTKRVSEDNNPSRKDDNLTHAINDVSLNRLAQKMAYDTGRKTSDVQSSHPWALIIKYLVYSRVHTINVLTTIDIIKVAYISLFLLSGWSKFEMTPFGGFIAGVYKRVLYESMLFS